MLIFLLFLGFDIEGDYYLQINHTSSSINLFFLDEGFHNPTAGYGIVGADLNPAVLAAGRNLDFYTGFSMSGKSSSNFEESFEISGVEDSVTIPFGIRYNEIGGMDFIGVSKKIGPVGIGISYQRGYKWGLEMGLTGSITGDFHPDEPFEFTHSDYSEIPEGDTIIIDIPFSGGISIETQKPLSVEYSSSPIFIGAGIGLGPLKLGAGMKFSRNKLFGQGSIAILPSTFSVMVDTVVRSPSGNDWTIDSLIGYATINDTLFYGKLDGDISSTQSAFTLGALLDVKILKASVAYEHGSSFGLLGGYEWLFSRIDDLPESFEIDTSSLVVDTINNRISGAIGIIMSSVGKDVQSEIGDADLYFSGYNSIRAGFQLDLLILKLGLSGSLDFPSAGDISIYEWCGGVSFGLPVPILDVNAGITGGVLWLDTEEENFFLPSATFGLSVGYKQDNFRVNLPLKINITQFLLGAVGDLEEEEVSFDFWSNVSFGLGIGVSL